MSAQARMSRGPQHLQALARANAVRLARAELKRRVCLGEISPAEVILRPPWEAESMSVSDLLTSQRRWGHTRCRKFLQCIPMSENKTIGSMTDRQRRALAHMLRAGEARTPPVERDERPQRQPAEVLETMLAGVG